MTWIKCLCLPQEPRSLRNIDDITEFILIEWKMNRYIQQCIFSMAGICDGTEGKFSDRFKDIIELAHTGERFRSTRVKHEKDFEFKHPFHCFFNINDKVFPNDDDCQQGVMCGLAALHTAAVLGCWKIQLKDGTNMKYMFCLHCRYFVNNPTTMNTHVRKRYKVGLFCGHPNCDFMMNHVKAMLQHRMLMHGYGKKSKNTPVRSNSRTTSVTIVGLTHHTHCTATHTSHSQTSSF